MRNPAEDTAEAGLADLAGWVARVIELTAHAAELATEPGARGWLQGATEDAQSLHEALLTAAQHPLDARQVAIVRSVYELWDANHDRTARIAADVDPSWYDDWRLHRASTRPGSSPVPSESPLTSVS